MAPAVVPRVAPDQLLQIVQLLIERGCQYNSRNNDGFTPSDYAYSYAVIRLHILHHDHSSDTTLEQIRKTYCKIPPEPNSNTRRVPGGTSMLKPLPVATNGALHTTVPSNMLHRDYPTPVPQGPSTAACGCGVGLAQVGQRPHQIRAIGTNITPAQVKVRVKLNRGIIPSEVHRPRRHCHLPGTAYPSLLERQYHLPNRAICP